MIVRSPWNLFIHFAFLLQAAEETGRKLKVYAVEKNPYAAVTLHVSGQKLS